MFGATVRLGHEQTLHEKGGSCHVTCWVDVMAKLCGLHRKLKHVDENGVGWGSSLLFVSSKRPEG